MLSFPLIYNDLRGMGLIAGLILGLNLMALAPRGEQVANLLRQGKSKPLTPLILFYP
jgi:hypothetical protein